MNEYLVKAKLKSPTLFGLLSTESEQCEVYQADSAQDAINKARAEIRKALLRHGITDDDLEELGVSISIVGVEKI